MCRQQFSLEQIEQTLELGKEYFSVKFKWLYEARSGNESWWMFDERTSKEIEDAFGASKNSIAINIAGYTYIIDFIKMQQYRYDNPTRIRRIKRQENESSSCFKIKGIAGLRVTSKTTEEANLCDENKEEAGGSSNTYKRLSDNESPLTNDNSSDDLSQTLTSSLRIDEEI